MSYIDKISRDGTDYDIQDSYAARSVEGSTASHVLQANEIYTETVQTQFSEFTFRTTGGDTSLETGDAVLEAIYGGCYQETPSIPETLTFEGSFLDDSTTVSMNKATWRGKISNSGTYTFTYDGAHWQLSGSNVSLSNYGLTVSGSVSNGDTIVVEYIKMVPSAITVATPTLFASTGFNQYDATAGYAHVVGGNQYRIAGTYTSLTFSTTPTGTTSAVTVTDNRFVPSEDGYIHVVGGSGDILIALVWSGIMDNEPYTDFEVSTIAIPTQDANNANLPTATYGMPGIGNIRDSISFTEKVYTQRIGRLAYNNTNYDLVAESGAPFIFDANYIYYPLASAVVYTLADSVSPIYVANDFGTEEFVGTTVPLYAGIRYGNSLVDKLRNLVDIQDVGDDLIMDGSTIKTAHELKDDVPAGFFSDDGTIYAEGTNLELDNTITTKFKEIQLGGDSYQVNGLGKNLTYYNVYDASESRTMNWSNLYLAPGTYTISFEVESFTLGTATAADVYLYLRDDGVSTQATVFADGDDNKSILHITSDTQIGTRYSFTFTINRRAYSSSSTANNLRMDATSYNKGARCKLINIQIEEGTTPTAYEACIVTPSPSHIQYLNVVTGDQKIDVYSNNVFDREHATADHGLSWTGGDINRPGSIYSDYFHVSEGETYWSNFDMVMYLYDSSKTLLGHILANGIVTLATGGQYYNTVTVPDDSGAVYARVTYSTSATNNPLDMTHADIMLNKGDKLLPYEPFYQTYTLHLGSIELCKIRENQDTIYKNGDNWYIKQAVEKITFTSSDFNVGSTSDGFVCGYTNTHPQYNKIALATPSYRSFCNSFIFWRGSSTWTKQGYCGFNNQGAFWCRLYEETSLTDFRAWIDENPLYVWAPKNYLTDVAITDATLISDLNKLEHAIGHGKKTYIKVTASELPGIAKVTAFRDNLAGVNGALETI